VRRYVADRFAGLLAALLGVSVLTFALGVLAPGDPAEVVLERALGQPPTEAQLAEQRREMGLDRPLPVQYVSWLGQAVQGDLGRSWVRSVRVVDALRERIPRTAALALAAAALGLAVGVPAGIVAAARRPSWADHLARAGALVGASFPSYFTAYVLIVAFAVRLDLLPVFGFGTAAHLVLPAVTLALGPAATLSRLTRSAVLEVLGEDYVRTARSKGLRQRAVLARHVLRNSLVPILTVAGLSLGHLLGGSLIVEYVFAWPGLGSLAVDAIRDRDYPLVQGVVLFTGTVYVVVNFLIDLAHARLDPRVRLEEARA
jgi:peptide/nickel transport system permease protein